MDPVRVTLASVAAAALLGGIFVGAYGFVALREYTPPAGDANVLHTGQYNMPAAQEALWQAFNAEEPAYLNEGMRMLMRMYGPGDIQMAHAEARHDPATGDHSIHLVIDLEEMAAAYGLDLEDDGMPDDDLGDADLFGFGFADSDTFEMLMARKGALHVIGFMGQNWAWRDYGPADDTFDLFGTSESSKDLDMPATISELEMFLSEDDDVIQYRIEPGNHEGIPTWHVTVSYMNDTTSGEASFHFRQSDNAPLHIDATFEGLLDSETLAAIREQDPDFPLDDLDMRMVITFEYGPIEIALPHDVTRLGVTVESSRVETETRHEITIRPDHKEIVPLNELEVRVVIADLAFFGGPEVHSVIATFDLAAGLEAESEGYRMAYLDNDGDGHLSPGDQIIVANDDGFWSNATHSASVMFWDKWAGQYEGAPAPAALWVIALLAAILGLARDKRRRRA